MINTTITIEIPKARLGAASAGFGAGFGAARRGSGCRQRGRGFDDFGGYFGERDLRHRRVHVLRREVYAGFGNGFGFRRHGFGRFGIRAAAECFRLNRRHREGRGLEGGAAIGAAQRPYPAGQCCIRHFIFGVT